ncbi:MAG: hypothetical protein QI199_07095 [Candidatus Korarchaeota archaeon]|nr:hypothetical protein [Candidatus Korarchaeota archaeon]
MTGPAPGKVRVPGVRAILVSPGRHAELEPQVYVHLKGHSRARVTHLDVEHPGLNELVPPGTSMYARARGTVRGIQLDFSRYVPGVILELEAPWLLGLLRPGEATIVYVGGKRGGVFLGFKKPFIPRLEELARRLRHSAS